MEAKRMDTRWILLATLWPICSFAGLAALLRSEQPLTKRAVASAILNSGFFGVVVGAVMIHRFGSEALLLTFGIAVLSGLGGNTAVDFALELLRTWAGKNAGPPSKNG